MISSHNKKFIFFHLYKVAGTSLRIIFDKYGEFRGGKHDRPSKFIEQYGKEMYNDYYKIAFVRNPFDWQVSLFHYMLRDVGHFQHKLMKSFKSFDEYIEWRVSGPDLITQYEFLSEDGSNNSPLTIDYIGKFETIHKDMDFLKEKLGMVGDIPHLNKTKHKPFMDHYNDKTEKMVRDSFKIDFETFNYE